MWIGTICICCFTCLYQPFMKIWVGEKYLLDMKMVILLCIYFYLYLINNLSCVYKDAGGIWHEDRYRPLIGSMVNLTVNLILVNHIGIYGVVISTICSYTFISMPWLIHNLFKLIFNRSPKEYIELIYKGILIAGIIAAACYGICRLIPATGMVQIIVYGVICLMISNVLLILVYHRNPMYDPFLELCDKVTKYKFHKVVTKLKLGGEN